MSKSLLPLQSSSTRNDPLAWSLPKSRIIRLAVYATLCVFAFALYNSAISAHDHRSAALRSFDTANIEARPLTARFEQLIAHLTPIQVGAIYDTDPNPKNLSIKYIKPDNGRPRILPDEDDPWPSDPLVAKYLSKNRFKKADGGGSEPPKPNFPDPSEAHSFPVPKDKQIPFSRLVGIEKARKVRHGQRHALPKIQASMFPKESASRKLKREKRKEWVRRAFRHSWEAYKTQAWGADEVKPLTGSSRSPFNGWGATIVDSLDTLLIMGFQHEYNLAREHVRQIDFTLVHGEFSPIGTTDKTLPVFESNIRYIGGLLGAFALSADPLMLERAKDVADWIMGAFGTATGLPVGQYRIGADLNGTYSQNLVLSEAGSMALEFIYLSQLSGNTDYFDVVQRVTDFLETGFSLDDRRIGTLLPTHINPDRSSFGSNFFTFGGLTDSYYEYLIKIHQILGLSAKDSQYAKMYTEAVDSAYRSGLVSVISPIEGSEMLVWGSYVNSAYTPRVEHLACFTGGMVAMSAQLLERPIDMFVAKETAETCFQSYNQTKSGLGAEVSIYYKDNARDKYLEVADEAEEPYLVPKGDPAGIMSTDARYLGRPEAIEAVFYMWRVTGDPSWQDKGWIMFTNWIRTCLADYGMASLNNVNMVNPHKNDNMESFVLAETFKYYYLLFSEPDYISLDDYVLNTEAHPFKLPKSAFSQDTTDSYRFWDGPDPKVEALYTDPHHPGESGHGTLLQQIIRTQKLPRTANYQKPVLDSSGFPIPHADVRPQGGTAGGRGMGGTHRL